MSQQEKPLKSLWGRIGRSESKGDYKVFWHLKGSYERWNEKSFDNFHSASAFANRMRGRGFNGIYIEKGA